MAQLVKQGLLVGPEPFCRPTLLRTTGLLQTIREKREVVLSRFQLTLQDVAFGRDSLGFRIGPRHIPLQRRVARFELLQTSARP